MRIILIQLPIEKFEVICSRPKYQDCQSHISEIWNVGFKRPMFLTYSMHFRKTSLTQCARTWVQWRQRRRKASLPGRIPPSFGITLDVSILAMKKSRPPNLQILLQSKSIRISSQMCPLQVVQVCMMHQTRDKTWANIACFDPLG